MSTEELLEATATGDLARPCLTDFVDHEEDSDEVILLRGVAFGGGVQALAHKHARAAESSSGVTLSRGNVFEASDAWLASARKVRGSRRWVDGLGSPLLGFATVGILASASRGWVHPSWVAAPIVGMVVFLLTGRRWAMMMNGQHGRDRKIWEGEVLMHDRFSCNAVLNGGSMAVAVGAAVMALVEEVSSFNCKVQGRNAVYLFVTSGSHKSITVDLGSAGPATGLHVRQLVAQVCHQLLGQLPDCLEILLGLKACRTPFSTVVGCSTSSNMEPVGEEAMRALKKGMALIGRDNSSVFKIGNHFRGRNEGLVCFFGIFAYCQEDNMYPETAKLKSVPPFVLATQIKREGGFVDQLLAYIGFAGTCSLFYLVFSGATDSVLLAAFIINLIGELLATLVSVWMYGCYGGNPIMHGLDPFHAALTWTYRGRTKARLVLWLEGMAGLLSAAYIVANRGMAGSLTLDAVIAAGGALSSFLTVIGGQVELSLFLAYMSEFLVEASVLIMALLTSVSNPGLYIALLATVAETIELLWISYHLVELWASSREQGWLWLASLTDSERVSLLAYRKRWDEIFIRRSHATGFVKMNAFVTSPMFKGCSFERLQAGKGMRSKGFEISSWHSEEDPVFRPTFLWFKDVNGDFKAEEKGVRVGRTCTGVVKGTDEWAFAAVSVQADRVFPVLSQETIGEDMYSRVSPLDGQAAGDKEAASGRG